MDTTHNLELPYIFAAQAQKHVTHNEAIRMLDSIVQLSVLSAESDTPPADPVEGERYIVGPSPTGAWAGNAQQIAAFIDGAWFFFPPREGWQAWDANNVEMLVFHNGTWTKSSNTFDGAVFSNVDRVGVNATADGTNRLSVSSSATLLNHEGADHRLAINKASAQDTASIVLQTAFEGRAEIGLAGDDSLSLKTTSDGQQWRDALVVSKADGVAHFPQNSIVEHMMFNLLQDGGRFAGTPEAQGTSIGAFVAPSYLQPFNGASFSSLSKYHYNSATYGGNGPALDPSMQALMSWIKSNDTARRWGHEFHALTINTGSGMTFSDSLNGLDRYLVMTNTNCPIWTRATWGFNLLVSAGSFSVPYLPDQYRLFVDGIEVTSGQTVTVADGWRQIVFIGIRRPQETYDHESTLFRLYAEPQSACHIVLPFIVPATILPKPGELFARVPSLTLWR